MNPKDLAGLVRAQIVEREYQSGLARTGQTPQHPLLIVFLDREAAAAEPAIRKTLGLVWSAYSEKIAFVSLADGMKRSGGDEALPAVMRRLFLMDSGLDGFDYNVCDVFFVTDTGALSSPGEALSALERAVGAVRENLNGHAMRRFYTVFLDTETDVGGRLRAALEAEAPEETAVFFIENRLDNGGMLVKENEGWQPLYQMFGGVIRMTQWDEIRFSPRLHAFSYRELTKPYAEMAAGTVLAFLENVNLSMLRWNEAAVAPLGISEAERRLGFSEEGFPFLERFLQERVYPRLPREEQLLLFGQREPEEVDPASISAADFNRLTMGAFNAFLKGLVGGDLADPALLTETYRDYLCGALPYYEILDCFDEQREVTDAAVQGIIARLQGGVSEENPPLLYAREVLRRSCYILFLQTCFAPAAQQAVAAARAYRDALFGLCADAARLPTGDLAVFTYYKNKAAELFAPEEIENAALLGAPDEKIGAYLRAFVRQNDYFGYPYEKELKSRLNNSADQVASIVRDRINSEVRYFSDGPAFYRQDVDVSGKLIFMDAQTDLCRDIRRDIRNCRICDTSLNNRVEVFRVYTYQP